MIDILEGVRYVDDSKATNPQTRRCSPSSCCRTSRTRGATRPGCSIPTAATSRRCRRSSCRSGPRRAVERPAVRARLGPGAPRRGPQPVALEVQRADGTWHDVPSVPGAPKPDGRNCPAEKEQFLTDDERLLPALRALPGRIAYRARWTRPDGGTDYAPPVTVASCRTAESADLHGRLHRRRVDLADVLEGALRLEGLGQRLALLRTGRLGLKPGPLTL